MIYFSDTEKLTNSLVAFLASLVSLWAIFKIDNGFFIIHKTIRRGYNHGS